MADFSKISPDNGQTILNAKDTNGRIMSEQLIRDTVGWTGKNLLKLPYAGNTGGSGITWSVDSDGIVTGTGTSTNDATYYQVSTRNDNKHIIPAGTYTFSGCPSGGSSGTYYLAVGWTKNGSYYEAGQDTGNGVTITLENSTDIDIRCIMKTGVSDKVFKPMIRLATITDGTYEPYHDDVETEITNMQLALTDTIENGTTASRAYYRGQHFYRNGKYATAVLDIASGATLTENTNYTTFPASTWFTRQLLDANYAPYVEANDNLNTYDWGFKMCTGSTSSSVSNKPADFTGSFIIYTLRTFGTDYKRQILIARDSADIYTRINNSGTWNSWKKITMS